MKIRILSNSAINKIAAGEVIERPSSVVKELVENSIDAGARKIRIFLERAGKNQITVWDDGAGMSREDLELSIQRHATSKLDEEDLLNINSFGFRGEALPSIGAISRFRITSRRQSAEMGYTLSINGGSQEKTERAQLEEGTVIEVRDLFFSTPARLKFLRTDKTELMAAVALVKKIALGHPHISFDLIHEGKELLKVRGIEGDFTNAMKTRITEIMGADFIENSVPVNFRQDNIELYGYTSLPTYNRASAEDQFLFINDRPIKDKILNIALRISYQDFISRDRHPVSVLFLKLDPHLVDVNVHPAKAEVRFYNPGQIQATFINAIKGALAAGGQRTSSTLGSAAINYMSVQALPSRLEESAVSERNSSSFQMPGSLRPEQRLPAGRTTGDNKNGAPFSIDYQTAKVRRPSYGQQQELARYLEPAARAEEPEPEQMDSLRVDSPLGAAKAQLHSTYIISQSGDSIIITDQHAAHERLGYEKIKAQIQKEGLLKQRLLMPEVIELPSQEKAEILKENASSLGKLGLSLEKFGEKSVIISEMPALLGDINIPRLVNDLADHLLEAGENIALDKLIENVTETYACYYAIRAGRTLSIAEMNELLRQMENTPFSAQCNHGRPTYIELKLKDIEKLFGRR